MIIPEKTACAYVRVSTERQEELSPDAQRRLITDYAKDHNITLKDEYIFLENGISGKKADKRPQFMKMIALAKSEAHPFDVILVWKFSRFARNQEESIVYKSLLKKAGVEVISISEPLSEGPFGTLIERIIEWMDEYYSIRLSGEVMRGMTEKAMRGGYQSALPYGYRMNHESGCPATVPHEALLVQKIYHDFLYNDKSCLDIARECNMLGLKTRHGCAFESRTIRYILQNPFYTGVVRWKRIKKDTRTVRDESEWIVADGIHSAIISKEDFDEVSRRLQTKKTLVHCQKSSMRHWISGVVKCSSCGGSLCACCSNNKVTSFQCGNYSRGSCSESHYIKAEVLEKVIFNTLYAINSDLCDILRDSEIPLKERSNFIRSIIESVVYDKKGSKITITFYL